MNDLLLLNIYRDTPVNPAFIDSIGQHIMAAYLNEHGYAAQVFSGRSHEARPIIQEQLESGVKVVGFYLSSDNKSISTNIIRWIKSQYNVTILIGGPEAIACDDAFFAETGCDFVIENEGEEPVRQLFNHWRQGQPDLVDIPNLKYLDADGLVVVNAKRYMAADLDALPYPSSRYSLNKRFRKGHQIGIITGRGCPFHCAFCYEGANAKNVRFRSVKNVMDEIDVVRQDNPRLDIVNIYDDTFTLQIDRVKQFCDEFKKRHLRWICEAHITNILHHPEMLRYMVDSGLVGMQIGIESGSDKVLAAYGKHTRAKDILDVVKLCKEMGLPTLAGNFIIGGAFEDRETFEESLDTAKKAIEYGRGMFECRMVFMALYPQTAIAKCPERFGLHVDEESLLHTLFTMHNPVMRTDALSVEELTELGYRFKRETLEKYSEQAFFCTRTDIERALVLSGTVTSLSEIWYNCYRTVEHLDQYIQNAMLTQACYDESFFPIRTFPDMNYCKKLKVSVLEYNFLKLSDGRSTLKQIGEKLFLKSHQMFSVFEKLNERCLVYLSEF